MTTVAEDAAAMPRTFVLAGGGSGGHISPGLAIAERLTELDPAVRCLFLCSGRPIDRLMLTDAGASFGPLPATPPSLHPLRAGRFVLNFARSHRITRRTLREHRVEAVVALGGFVAAPVVRAASARGVAVTLMNLDDPPGRANRWMARRCSRVMTAVPLTDHPGFAEQVIGMPLRRSAVAEMDASACRRELGLDVDRRTLLVTGASQGSTSINRFVAALAEADPEAFAGCQVLHLTGHGAEEETRRAYAQTGVKATVLAFERRMGLAWGAADLAVSRGGASSVAEAAANAVPTVFLPYPFHRDRHQERNARPLADLGAAVIVDDRLEPELNVRTAGAIVTELLGDPARLRSMRERLRSHRAPDAALTLARILLGTSVG